MSFTIRTMMMLLLTASFATMGCTRRAQNAVVEPSKKGEADKKADDKDKSPFTDPNNDPFQVDPQGDARFEASFQESNLRSLDQTFSTNAPVQYLFKYLTIEKSGTLEFINGKAEIQLSGLPTGQAGVIYFDLIQGGVKKFTGQSATQVTLNAGTNQATINMKAVDPQNPNPPQQGADLDLKLEYNNPNAPTPPSPNPPTPPSPNPNPGPNPTPPNPNLDPRIASWDGKQDLVISNVWKIIDLN